MKWREGQIEVMNYEKGILAVPSVPGAGKTTVITSKTVDLITKGLNKNGKILIVTFTNSAVSNFKNKLKKLLKEKGMDSNYGWECKTLHSLANSIIRESPKDAYLDEEFEVIDDIEATDIIRNHSFEFFKRYRHIFIRYLNTQKNNSQEYIEKIEKKWNDKFLSIARNIISYLKSKGIRYVQAQEILKKYNQMDDLLKIIFNIYIFYEKELIKKGKVDYDDIIIRALNLLESRSDILESLQDRYTYIFEDEAQDSSPMQERILFLLSQKHKNLARVGDPNQAIMSTFTNSDYKLFRKFCEREDVKKIVIPVSSRNTKNILGLANYLVKWSNSNKRGLSKEEVLVEQYIKPVDKDDPYQNPIVNDIGIYVKSCDNEEMEMKQVVGDIKKSIKKYPNKTMALLLRYNFKIDKYINFLEKENIPYQVIDRYRGESAQVIEKIGKIVDFISNPDENKLTDLLNLFYDNEIQEDEMKELNKYSVEEIFFPQTYKGIDSLNINEDLKEILNNIKNLFEYSTQKIDKFLVQIGEEFNFNLEELTILDYISTVCNKMFFENPHFTLENLAYELLKNKNSFNYFASIVFENKGYEPKKGCVTITTCHKAKGLEWDIVFLPHMTYSDYPGRFQDKFIGELYYLKDEYKNIETLYKSTIDYLIENKKIENSTNKMKREILSETLKLVYVAFTRAKERLFVFTNGKEYNKSVYYKVVEDFLRGVN
ncbi:ATP-dependent helicase [Tepidibacter formicigenes]|jgi:DNA helicase-2/ATP-dependent DNA helicase PcrA|uniref:DNA 3'-5' helicase n=1 Tax=Tepidibacter formicigenes DSM 15518 TaxID=1123349 RepID=A0A1M6P3H3_9FIRM|nr:ATP-dependent helicase [Tepidibacter formicigenes]SHK02517.1 DNA helicase-2 / ATP-dependent DNA helicase PcrA [Tepidibacter formicigenes DSM 15518]